jgi:hypothetical protein
MFTPFYTFLGEYKSSQVKSSNSYSINSSMTRQVNPPSDVTSEPMTLTLTSLWTGRGVENV